MTNTGTARLAAVLLLGPTGAGKTPLGEFMERNGLWGRRCAHFDFGANLRRAAEDGGRAFGLQAGDVETIRRVLSEGALLSDAQFPIAVRILTGFAAAANLSPGDWVVLNGLPRHEGQARGIVPVADVRCVISLDCPADVARQRIRTDSGGDRAGRLDDSPEEVERKLEVFRRKTRPLLDHYRGKQVRIAEFQVAVNTSPVEIWTRLEESGPPVNP